MSPEANKPETQKPSEISTTEHPEGVRPFTADLADVHEHLESPDDASAIDPITRSVDFDRIPRAETESRPTEAISADTESRSGWKKWVAGVVGGAVLAGGGFAVHQATGDSERPVDSTSATPNAGEEAETSAAPNAENETPAPETTGTVETTGETVISGLNKKATPEQVQYVIDNPVNISEAATVGEAFEALGDRLTVLVNSGEPDLDAPLGEVVFTPETEATYEAMGRSFFDVTSPHYDAMLESMRDRRHQIGAMFMVEQNAETRVDLVATTNADMQLEPNATVDAAINTIWVTNQPDTRSGDGKYNNDYSSTMTLQVDAAGDIRVYNSTGIADIGNIG